MGTNSSHTTTSDLEHAPYTLLHDRSYPVSPRRPLKGFAVILASVLFLVSLVALILNQSQQPIDTPDNAQGPLPSNISIPLARGVAQGVSAKSNPSFSGHEVSYNWTNAMLSWQRTAYHFQPETNWMNGRCNEVFDFLWSSKWTLKNVHQIISNYFSLLSTNDQVRFIFLINFPGSTRFYFFWNNRYFFAILFCCCLSSY